jgi:purine-binding chemotaxis protein CheW
VTSSEERTETVLRERAKQLAIPGESETNDYFDVLAFQLGAESYGVELCHTTGVHFLRDLMPVPLSPPFVVGAINLRGTVVSVLDLGRLLEVPGSAVVERDQIIALHFEEVEVALMTDRISGVRRVSRSQLQPGLPNLSGMNASYVEGITRDRMILLDVKRLLSDPKISAEGEF